MAKLQAAQGFQHARELGVAIIAGVKIRLSLDQVLANLPHGRPACGFIRILFDGRVKQRAQCTLYGFSHMFSSCSFMGCILDLKVVAFRQSEKVF